MSKGKKRPVLLTDSEEDSEDELDEEQVKLVPTPKKKSKAERASTGSDSSDSDDDWRMEGKGKVKPKKKQTSKGVASRDSPISSSSEELADVVLEEGELSDPIVGGAETSESQSDSELEYGDGLDENMFGDAADRERLAKMTEAEREQEMFARFERREAWMARLEIKRELKLAKKKEQKSLNKVHRSLRPKERRKSEDKSKSQAIDELRAKRQARKTQDRQSPVPSNKELLPSNKEVLKATEVFTSDEDDSPSHCDDEKNRSPLTDRTKTVSSLEELVKIKLSRYRLEKWIHMPFFEDTIKGCFVRVGIGNHDGKPVYRLAEVVGIQETSKVYGLGGTKTNKGLKLRHGLQERVFRIEYVSNSNFTTSEFNHWKKEMEKTELPFPTIEFVEQKLKQIERAKSYEFTDEQIDQIVQEKEKFRKNPRNYAMTKHKLLREKALAAEEGNEEKLESINQQLAELEERAVELDKQRTKGLTAITYINERNRQDNLKRIEEALKEEFANRKEADDPFTRRKCTPTLVHLAKGDKPEVKQLELESEPTVELVPTELFPEGSPVTEKATAKQVSTEQDDLFSAHDFDIQIDLPSDSNGGVSINSPRISKLPREDSSRRSLNLSDYKKRKGLI